MANEIGIKQGATLQLLVTLLNDDDSAVDLTGITYAAQLRDVHGTLVDILQMSITGNPGELVINQATAGWPVGRLVADVKVSSPATGIILKSQTLGIQVSAGVTV